MDVKFHSERFKFFFESNRHLAPVLKPGGQHQGNGWNIRIVLALFELLAGLIQVHMVLENPGVMARNTSGDWPSCGT